RSAAGATPSRRPTACARSTSTSTTATGQVRVQAATAAALWAPSEPRPTTTTPNPEALGCILSPPRMRAGRGMNWKLMTHYKRLIPGSEPLERAGGLAHRPGGEEEGQLREGRDPAGEGLAAE